MLLLPPTQRDGEASRALLKGAGIECVVCREVESLCDEVRAGASVVIVGEEQVAAGADRLEGCLRGQPVWSDLPVIVLVRAGAESAAVGRAVSTLGNVSLVERPVRASTLLSVVRAALRARERQYEVREHIAAAERGAEELRRSRKEAEAASAAKDEFIAVLSHELRTPLTPVLLTTALLQDRADLPEDVRADLEGIRRNIELESRLIGDLLDLTKIAKGKWQLEVGEVNLHVLLGSAISIAQREGTARIVVDLSARAHHVTGDSARLHQVFWNLLSNALKFTPAEGTVTVRTGDAPGGGRVWVEVIDTGRGIEASLMPRLFTAFEQGNQQIARQFGGLGLGLAITRKLVEAHGGTITVSSAGAGRGSTFRVELATTTTTTTPRRAGGNGSAGAAGRANERRSDEKAARRVNVRILLVEDHEPTLKAMHRLLQGFGHRVATASSVASARATAGQGEFDLLLSDVGLPDGSGLDLVREIGPMFGGRSIALTGYGMERDVADCMRAGFTAHITKPVDPGKLREIIERVAGDAPE